jgi:hypothetical protein
MDGKGRRDRDGMGTQGRGKEKRRFPREIDHRLWNWGGDDENLRISFCRTLKKNARDQIEKVYSPNLVYHLLLSLAG